MITTAKEITTIEELQRYNGNFPYFEAKFDFQNATSMKISNVENFKCIRNSVYEVLLNIDVIMTKETTKDIHVELEVYVEFDNNKNEIINTNIVVVEEDYLKKLDQSLTQENIVKHFSIRLA